MEAVTAAMVLVLKEFGLNNILFYSKPAKQAMFMV